MPVQSVPGKSCTVTYGTLDASAQVTSINPARTKGAEVTETLGAAVTSNSSTEITIPMELLFDPTDSGISALLHAAWIAGSDVGLIIDYGTATSTYTAVKVSDLGEAVPADGLVTQTVTFTSAEADTFTWATPATAAVEDEEAPAETERAAV